MWSQLFFKWRWIQFRIVCIVQSFQVKTWQWRFFNSSWSLIIFKFWIFFSFCLGCKLWKCSLSLTATWPFEACWTWESIASANSIFTIPTGNKRGSKTTLLFNFCQVKIHTWAETFVKSTLEILFHWVCDEIFWTTPDFYESDYQLKNVPL